MSIPWQLKQDMAEIARQRGKSVTACWRDAVETLYAEELHKLRRQREDVA